MSTPDERAERTEPGSGWLPPHKARKLRDGLAMLGTALEDTTKALRTNLEDMERLRARVRELEEANARLHQALREALGPLAEA